MSPVDVDGPHAEACPSRPAAALDSQGRARTQRNRRRLVWRVAASVVTAAILIACFVPDPGLPPTDVWPLDKVAHALAFAAFAFCWRMAGLRALVVLLAGALLTAATEAGQGAFLPDRAGEWGDAAADAVGLALGLGLTWFTGARHFARPLLPPGP